MAERLTIRDENGEAYVPLENQKPPYPLVTDDAVEKLAHYEDLEEQGRLLVLPENITLEMLTKTLCNNDSGCPGNLGLKENCKLSCEECWLAALKGVEHDN